MNRVLAGLAIGFVVVIGAACGPGADGPGATGTAGARPTPPPRGQPAAESCNNEAAEGSAVVELTDPQSFTPSEITIAAGESVTWTNASNTNHTVTFDGGPDCGYVLLGRSASIQFETPGTYTYVCRIHAQHGMRGSVTVE
jgi:plastocyanin